MPLSHKCNDPTKTPNIDNNCNTATDLTSLSEGYPSNQEPDNKLYMFQCSNIWFIHLHVYNYYL